MNRINVPVEKKVNLLDYLRTPNRVFKKIGLEDQADQLRQQYDKVRIETPREINKITEWSKQVSPDANERIFDYLDGKTKSSSLSFSELKVATEIKNYLKDWAKKLKLPEDNRVSDYITHLFPRGAINKEFDEDIAKIVKGRVVKSVYDPFLQKRTNKPEYLRDTWQALDAYTKRAVRKYYMDPILEQVAKSAKDLPYESYNYVKGRISRLNMQPTDIEDLADNLVKSSPVGYKLGQRPLTYVSQKLRQLTATGLMGLNPGTALRNIQQSTNTYAVVGEKNFGKGIFKSLQIFPDLVQGKDTELERLGILGDDIIQDRTINATKKFWQNVNNKMFTLFDLTEKFNRSVAFYSGKYQGLERGMNEAQAVEHAKKVIARTQFLYDTLDTPAALQNDISKTVFQFAKYPLAQSEFLIEMVKNKEAAASVRWLASNLLFIAAAGKLLGLDYRDMFPQFRFGVPPSLSLPGEIVKAATNVPDKYGNIPTTQKKITNITNAAINYFPGGNQLRKTFQGLQSYARGQSITPSGNQRFPVAQTPSNLVRSALFGQYATQEGRQYIENLGVTKGEQLYNQLKKLGPEKAALKAKELKVKDPVAYRSLMNFGRDKSLKITTKEKQLRNLNIKDGSRARGIVKLLNTKKTAEEKAAVYKRFIQLGIITQDIERQIMAARKAGALK